MLLNTTKASVMMVTIWKGDRLLLQKWAKDTFLQPDVNKVLDIIMIQVHNMTCVRIGNSMLIQDKKVHGVDYLQSPIFKGIACNYLKLKISFLFV